MQLQLVKEKQQRSAVRRGSSTRREFDRYLTPRFACEALIDNYPEIGGITCVEPCSGGGVLEQVLRARFHHVITNDIDPSVPADTHFDASRPDAYGDWYDMDGRLSWVITNPPFNQWANIAKNALDHDRSLALLLRVTALEATKKRLWLHQRAPTALLILPRIRFTAQKSTDACCYVWAIWSREVPAGIRYANLKMRQQSLFLGVAA